MEKISDKLNRAVTRHAARHLNDFHLNRYINNDFFSKDLREGLRKQWIKKEKPVNTEDEDAFIDWIDKQPET